MQHATVRGWLFVHEWTSLSCTLFLLALCLTGLPLIFHDEIDAAVGRPVSLVGPASSSQDPRLLPLDAMLRRAVAERRGEVPLFMAFDNHGPLLTITTGPAPDAPPNRMTLLLFDRVSGRLLSDPGARGVTDFLLDLHKDLFLGLPGMLLVGAMGVLFAAALVSGVVLYAPFMRKLDFGTLRNGRRRRRLQWLDWHNLLGITAVSWMSVVAITGIINALAEPLVDHWRNTALVSMASAYTDHCRLSPGRYASLDSAMRAARSALPGKTPQFIAFPGGSYSSANHYAVFFQGDTPLTERLLTPALIDARTGKLTDVRPMPVSMKALQLSQPLHFGDYGGLPLKLLWAALTVFTILVLVSGLYLWIGRRSARSPGSRSARRAVRAAPIREGRP